MLLTHPQSTSPQVRPRSTRRKEEYLTTQEAADKFSVSHTYLLGMLIELAIPYIKAGTHCMVLRTDLADFKARAYEAREKALTQMTQEAQDIGLY